ncbi:MAG: flippase [Oscillospiraceae bacterium]|nr:flippase [Oscillospiraceae bacterium]
MKEQRSIRKNVVMNAILTASSVVFPLITFPYTARTLLPEGNGKLTFASAIVAYFIMASQLGIPTYGIRACARVRDDREALSRTVQELLRVQLVTCLVSCLLYVLAVLGIPRLREDRLLFAILGLSIVLNAIGAEWLYQALEEYAYITVRSVVFKLLALIPMFLLIHKPEDYVIYGCISLFASSASYILNFVNLRRHVDLRPRKDLQPRRHVKMIFVFFAMSVATVIYTNLDNVMLGFMTDDSMVEYYGSSVKIKNILVSLITSAGAVLLPRASYYAETGLMDEFWRILKKVMHFIVMAALPLALYFGLFAEETIRFLPGEAYEGAIRPMQIIMPTMLLIGVTNVLGIQTMVPMGMEKQVLGSEIAGALTDFGLNLLLIPRYGAAGAALGTLAAEAVVLLWQLAAMRALGYQVFAETPFGKLLLAAALAFGASFWVKSLGLAPFPALLLSALLFFGVYAAFLLAAGDALLRSLAAELLQKTGLRRRAGPGADGKA